MELLSQIILAVVICGAILIVLWAIRGLLLTPVRTHDGAEVFSVVRLEGDGAGAEETIRGLLWLRDSGKIQGKIIIAIGDVTADAVKRAAIVADNYGIYFCPVSELSQAISEI
jgi:hypothetical protein